MRKMLLVSIIILSLLATSFPFQDVAGDDLSVPTHGLTIEARWIDIIQQDDHSTLSVNETILFNNSGTSIFNGSIYAWVPDGSVVRSMCCGGVLNMGCRIREFGYMDCFTFNWQDDNIIYGNPFAWSFISYYGQRETITVNAQSQNFSDTDTLELNVTVGGVSEAASPSTPTGSGLHVTSERNELGVRAFTSYGTPANLTLTQTINLTNNGSGNDTIDLEVLGLPQGWNASFLYDGDVIDSIPLNLTENKSVLLRLKVPSYIAEILVSYTVNLPVSEQDKLRTVFEKQVLYDSKAIYSFVFTLEGTNITVCDDMTIHYSKWNSTFSMTVNFILGSNLPSGTTLTYSLTWEDAMDISWLILLLVAIVFAAIIAFAVLVKRRKKGEKAKEDEDAKETAAPEAPGDQVKAITEEQKATKEALERLEADHQKGLLPASAYQNMKEKLEKKKVELNEELAKAESAGKPTLEDEKRAMLLAIKRLKKDRESGKISDDAYNELYSEYKKKTIEIMKELNKRD